MNDFIYSDDILIDNPSESKEKSNFSNEDQKLLNSFETDRSEIDFATFFQKAEIDDIFIFPIQNILYLVVQRKAKLIEENGILDWNEVDGFGNLINHKENMIRKIDSREYLFQKIKEYITDFTLYEIPFYFIPIVKETYCDHYGLNKGNWRIFIHDKVRSRDNKLVTHVEKQYRLRDYQKSCIDAWRDNNYFGTISIATAGGKTVIGIEAIYELGLTTIIAVPTEPLLFQWKKDIETLLSLHNDEIGVFYGKKKELKKIIIGTYTSLMKYITFTEKERDDILKSNLSEIEKQKKIQYREKLKDFLQNYYSFLIMDEAHHIPAPLFRQLALNSKALKRLSLSATVKRFDKNETLLFFSSGKTVFQMNYLQLCELGWVIPFYYKYVPVHLTEDQIDSYIRLGLNLEKKRYLTFFNDQKLVKVIKIVSHHVNTHNHQILIFVSYIDSAFEIYDRLREIGVKCDLVISELNQKRKSDKHRSEVIDEFKDKRINVIISTTVLDEGFNVPEANVGIIVSGSGNDRQLTQRIGRMVRKSEINPDKIGYIYEITTEGNSDIVTLDESNRLSRNNMIISLDQYLKDKMILEPECWTFNYELINQYAEEKAKNTNKPLINIDV